ncbi:recombinase family protein [Pygmaiobacter massiliensis]|uniref:recombinase family protein n=1 Tax=Pygmaiobacter massiliensis TaxID=1917873 RepID=UPI002A825DBE|nr:recombinase family protein [Pygmaiobacter massiliensis]MDY4785127.1 recombinase family protein [Pygmaiobacter massiliensis]
MEHERIIQKIAPLMAVAPAKERVAAYARVSSGKDAMLHSLSAQVSYYSSLIQRRSEWEYAGVYSDEAFTGTKAERPGFQQMLRDCREGKIQKIITKSVTRFARNTLTLLGTVRELKDMGVDVWFEKENIHSMGGDGELMLTILASFAQEESRSVSENCKWRIRKGFEAGELVNLRFLFGYDIRRGSISVNQEQAAIIRRIFADYVGGEGCTEIARRLRSEGAEALRGGVWTTKRVAELLRNEKYAGNALLQKKYVQDHLTKKLVPNRGQLPQYYAEGTHPPIVDEALFRQAQAQMDRNREHSAPQSKPGRYPFSGRIRCPHCGKFYKRKVCHGKVYWNCSTYLTYGKGSCFGKQIPEETLQSLVAQVLDLPAFDAEIFAAQIAELEVPAPNQVLFRFADGGQVLKSWQDHSRRDSWTEDMRQAARVRAIEQRRCG